MTRVVVRRPKLSFRSVNVRGKPGYQPEMQRHHLLPQQLLATAGLAQMLDHLGREQVGFDDFRCNGLLLPASEAAALRAGMPLHRGPHRQYNAMVAERVGQIEQEWAQRVGRCPLVARRDAIFRLALLQRALRRRLLDTARGRLTLCSKDPIANQKDFSELDALVDQLWPATGF